MLNYLAILTFVVLFIFGTLGENFLNHGQIRRNNKFVIFDDIKNIDNMGWARITIPAVIVGVVDFFVYAVAAMIWLEWMFFVATIMVLIFYIYLFVKDGDRLRELIVFLPLFVMPCIVLQNVGKWLAVGIQSDFWADFVAARLPLVGLILGIGIPIAILLLKKAKKVLAAILAFILMFSTVAIVAYGANINMPDGSNSVVSLDDDDINNLTVRKLTIEELEELTLTKYKGISEEFLQSSLSTYDAQRTQSTGFSDALTFGFAKKTSDEMFYELEEEILRNPVYGVTVASALKDKKVGSYTIGSLNPWMGEMVDKNEKGGVAYWLEYRDNSGVIYVTKEYRCYAATLCTFLERLINEGTQTKQTSENWCLSLSSDNNSRKGIKADYQYKKEALVLSYVTKNGDKPLTIGFNIHDKRPEFFVTEKSSNPLNPSTPAGGKKGGGGGSNKPEPTTEPPTTPGKKNPKKDPKEDPVNQGNADKGGGDNKPGDGSGDYQKNDSREETTTTKTPDTPPVDSGHKSENIVDHENKMDYTTDPATDRGARDKRPPTSDSGDGEFTPNN